MKLLKILLILVLVSISGCAWFRGEGASSRVEIQKQRFVEFGRLVRPSTLKQSAEIAVVPFSAGPSVEANDELDKIALMISDGFADILKDADINLKWSQDFDKADFIVEGYITEKTQTGRLKKWMPGKDPLKLAIEAEIRSARSEELLAVIRHHKETTAKKINHRILGREIGRNIAEYLVSELQ